MAQVITLSKHRTRNMIGNRKGTGRVKEIIKEGMFNIAEFGNWLTGFKQDEVVHGSRALTELHTPKVSPRRRYF